MKERLFSEKLVNFIILGISVSLLFAPFFWFKYPQMDLGGDSSRLYFYDPISWLKNIAIYSTNSLTAMGTENPNFMMIPFLSFLVVLKKILFNNPYFLNCFFSGVLLSGSFVFTFMSLNEILCYQEKNSVSLRKISAAIGALFFSFSPLIIYEWQKALYSFNQIFVYPLALFLLLKFIKTANYKYLFFTGIVSFVFSVNFSFPTFPWFFSFFSFSLLFLYYYSKNLGRVKVYKKGLIVFTGIFLSLQLFHLIPQIVNVLNFSNPNSQAIFDNVSNLNRGLQYFLSVQPYVRLTYTWLNQPQFMLPTTKPMYEFGLRYRYLFYIYIYLVLAGGIIVKRIGSQIEKKLYAVICAFFLILSFLMTANINNFLLELYKFMFSIPGFSMFRSYYTKFGMTFVFFYAMLLAYSLVFILNYLKNVYSKIILIVVLLLLIVFNGWPLLSGKIVNAILSQSKNVKLPIEMDQDYLKILNLIKMQELDSKYLSFPLANEYYQVVQGKEGGAYFGPSITGILAGKNDFCGQESFGLFKNEIMAAMEEGDIQTTRSYLKILGIRYIYHNSDNYIYDKFGGYPYSELFRKIFPDQQSITNFISKLGYEKSFQINNFSLYLDDDNYLPHLYVPKKVVKTNLGVNVLPEIFSSLRSENRPAVLFEQQNKDKQKSNYEDNEGSVAVIEYKKINPAKYRIIFHQAKGVVPLVFSEEYHTGWRLYNAKSKPSDQNLVLNIFQSGFYPTKENDKFDQADKEEVDSYILKGWISGLRKGSADIRFISKNFQGVILNKNLEDGKYFETLFSRRDFQEVQGKNHYIINGYANLWTIDFPELCQRKEFCLENDDGTFETEMILEFFPQRFFYLGLILSGLALLAIVGGFFYPFLKNDQKIY